MIRYNCIKDAIGYGKLDERPYYTYGIFLDNEASGYTIHHNGGFGFQQRAAC